MENKKLDRLFQKSTGMTLGELLDGINNFSKIEEKKDFLLELEGLRKRREINQIEKWKVAYFREFRRKRMVKTKKRAKLISLEQDFGVAMDKHHVTPEFIVHVPVYTHRAFHKLGSGNKFEGVLG